VNFDQMTLSPLDSTDLDAFLAIYSHPKISNLIELQLDREAIRNNFELALSEKNSVSPKQLINSIRLSEESEIVGMIGFIWDRPGGQSGELGIVLMPGKTFKGTANVAMKRFIETLFTRYAVTLIHSRHNVTNKAAFFVAKSVGFEFEIRRDPLDAEKTYRYGEISLSRWQSVHPITPTSPS